VSCRPSPPVRNVPTGADAAFALAVTRPLATAAVLPLGAAAVPSAARTARGSPPLPPRPRAGPPAPTPLPSALPEPPWAHLTLQGTGTRLPPGVRPAGIGTAAAPSAAATAVALAAAGWAGAGYVMGAPLTQLCRTRTTGGEQQRGQQPLGAAAVPSAARAARGTGWTQLALATPGNGSAASIAGVRVGAGARVAPRRAPPRLRLHPCPRAPPTAGQGVHGAPLLRDGPRFHGPVGAKSQVRGHC